MEWLVKLLWFVRPVIIFVTSIGRFAGDREFVNIENASQDCAQDHQEDPKGTILGQDGAQDRQEDAKDDY